MNGFSLTHRTLRANGVDLHCAEAGDPAGPLLVLLHGFPEFWFAWRDYIPALAAAGFHVVAPDQRGYGLSDKPQGVDAYRLDTLADDIAGLATALGRETFQVVGHDWGGSVAWTLAGRHGARVARMAVLNAPHPAVWVEAMASDPVQRKKSGYVRVLQIPWLPETLLRLGRYDGLRKALAAARQDAFPPDVMRAYEEAWRRPGAATATLNWYRALLRRPPAMPAAKTLAPPCLVIWGEDDPYAIPRLADDSAALCVEAQVVRRPGVGHWIHHDDRPATLARLLGFLKPA